jgi:uncharacterized membrane protein YdbT with pleckstrin-like domain
MDLHPGENTIFEGRPSWRSIIGFYAAGLLAAVAVGVIVALADKKSTGVVVYIVLMAIVLIIGWVRRISTHYTITNERLHIQRGLLSRKSQQTNLERVQNVNTSQSLGERLLRVGTVDFDTAGTDDADFTFAGVANPAEVVQAVDRAQREAGSGAPPAQSSPPAV